MSDQHTEVSLLSVGPTRLQERIAALAGTGVVASLAISAPFADVQLPQIGAFVPAVESVVIVTDFITAVLLFSQSRITRSRALLALASGYLFTSLIVLSHILTFPGAFSPDGLLRAGPQTAGWLYVFWHLGLAMTILIYSHLKNQEVDDDHAKQSSHSMALSVAIAVGIACALTTLATAGAQFLPAVFLDPVNLAPLARYVLAFNGIVCVAAFAALWGQRKRSELDLWLMIVTLALICEIMSNALLISSRFTFGWYASRLFSIVTSAIVLAVLVEETVMLYGRMARSNEMLLRERKNRLLNLEALASAIRHEVGQPLAAVELNAQAIELFLQREPPKVEAARSAAEDTIAGARRISEVLDDIGGLFGKARREPVSIDLNDAVLEVLHGVDAELKARRITARVELTPDLPPVIGRRGQLQEVLVNLVQNAIDALESVEGGDRELRLETETGGKYAAVVTVADNGPGIDPGKSEEIFEAFFTTKQKGMGLGLAICRMIVERHGGQLVVSSARPHGAVFQIRFPCEARL